MCRSQSRSASLTFPGTSTTTPSSVAPSSWQTWRRSSRLDWMQQASSPCVKERMTSPSRSAHLCNTSLEHLTTCVGCRQHNMPGHTCHAQVESVFGLNTTCRPVILHTWHRPPAHDMCRHVPCAVYVWAAINSVSSSQVHPLTACLLFLSGSHYPPAQTSCATLPSFVVEVPHS